MYLIVWISAFTRMISIRDKYGDSYLLRNDNYRDSFLLRNDKYRDSCFRRNDKYRDSYFLRNDNRIFYQKDMRNSVGMTDINNGF